MPTAKNLNTPQKKPNNVGDPIVPLVIKDLQNRRKFGRKKYGKELCVWNGRDPLIDAYQEALDLAIYLRQAIEQHHTAKNAIEEYIKHIGKRNDKSST